ncbi:hypothetical protein OOK13_00825 [Streptomyces sp. NBC_00378]|uniref:hypothetical protein n=1 Tax=unclassified Streptomyces TaxID=2593676 RepID=UPI00224EFA24|nr:MULTISPECIES: hypothetical protein [unclassified Streptomyces]MCX5107129.1 hypothetical protein [Streptomyces sp. NBC_00378]
MTAPGGRTNSWAANRVTGSWLRSGADVALVDGLDALEGFSFGRSVLWSTPEQPSRTMAPKAVQPAWTQQFLLIRRIPIPSDIRQLP